MVWRVHKGGLNMSLAIVLLVSLFLLVLLALVVYQGERLIKENCTYLVKCLTDWNLILFMANVGVVYPRDRPEVFVAFGVNEHKFKITVLSAGYQLEQFGHGTNSSSFYFKKEVGDMLRRIIDLSGKENINLPYTPST